MRLSHFLAAVWAVVFAVAVQANDAESVKVENPEVSLAPDGDLALNARVSIGLSRVLVDAVTRGVPLYFVTEFELAKKRWYWFDEKLVNASKTVRISYHALTQQYRVAVGGLHQMSYPSLEEALSGALSIRGWRVADGRPAALGMPASALVRRADDFEARVRVRLDGALLPKPLQVNALTSRDWNLSSDWVPADIVESFSTSP